MLRSFSRKLRGLSDFIMCFPISFRVSRKKNDRRTIEELSKDISMRGTHQMKRGGPAIYEVTLLADTSDQYRDVPTSYSKILGVLSTNQSTDDTNMAAMRELKSINIID